MKKDSISSLDRLLQEITPEEQEKTNAKMLLAAKIADAMAAKGWNNKMLMDAMGKKNASEITRWLSGTHNFTSDLLSDLSFVLGIDLLNVEEHKYEPIINFYHLFVKSDSSSIGCENPLRAEIGNPFYNQRIQIKAKVQ